LITVLGAGWHATLTSLAGAGALQSKKEKKKKQPGERMNRGRRPKAPSPYEIDRIDTKKMNRDRQKFLRRKQKLFTQISS